MNARRADMDFIFLTSSRWDDVSSTAYSLAQQFSKTNRVFFIDKPFTWLDLLRYKRNRQIGFRTSTYFTNRNRYRKLTGVPVNFTLTISFLAIPYNWLPKGRIYNLLLTFHRWRMERIIQKLIKKFSIRNYILFNSFNPFYAPRMRGNFRPYINLYQCVDSMTAAKYLSKHGPYLELETARNADLVLATSKQIVKNLKSNGIESHYLPNAADVDHFKSAYFKNTEKPREFMANTRTIGYIGSVDFRSNFQLLSKLALHNQEKIIMLIGPVRKETNMGDLLSLPNVVFVGPKSMDELPLYAKSLDCAIIPFEHNEFTRSVYPLKINEYLAAGRPVVTTQFSEEMEDFKEIAHVTDSEQEFIEFVDLAIKGNTHEKELERIRFSEANSWAKRVDQFWQIVGNQIGASRV